MIVNNNNYTHINDALLVTFNMVEIKTYFCYCYTCSLKIMGTMPLKLVQAIGLAIITIKLVINDSEFK